MILVSRNTRYMRIFDSGVVKECNLHRLLLAMCSETLDKYIQDIQPFDGFSVVPNA